MTKYEVIGYEERSGVSKSKGTPYDFQVLHVREVVPFADGGPCYGCKVESIIFNRLITGGFEQKPLVGDYINVFFNRQGFAEDIQIL